MFKRILHSSKLYKLDRNSCTLTQKIKGNHWINEDALTSWNTYYMNESEELR